MKKSIIIPLLLASLFTFSQGSNVAYDFQNGRPLTTDVTTNLNLPLIFSFTDKFNGKSVKFLNEDGTQVVALNNSKFGAGDLSKDGETNTFHIVINADRTVNPGDEKLNTDTFILQIEQVKFTLSLSPNPLPDNPSHASTVSGKKDYVAGYIYYDAIKLVELLNNKSDDRTITEILKAYNVDVQNIEDNRYLDEVFGDFLSQRAQGGAASSFLTNLGNTDVTYFAAGLARFLAERTREELNEAFFTKMKEQLNAYPELKTIFPKTASFLDVIETYSYASVIQVLKESFETDIQNLPENLYSIKNLTKAHCDQTAICGSSKKDCTNYSECQTRLDDLHKFFESQDGRWIGLGMFTVKEAIQSPNPADLLKSISESSELTGIKGFSITNEKYTDYNVASSIELANFISQSLISQDDNQVWINSKELNELFKGKDKKAFKTYIGLMLAIEQKGDVIIDFYKSDKKPITFGKILIQIHDSLSKYEPLITSLIKNTHSAFNSANNSVRKMLVATDNSIEADPQALYDYYRTFTASLKPIAQSTFFSTITGSHDIAGKYDTIEKYLNPAVDIAYHISTKKYSAAVYDAVLLLNNIHAPAFEKPVVKSFIKYGTLISTVASAQSSDEVKQALEASVLPVGSASIKRNSNWSISVNSYVGGFYGKAYTNELQYLDDSLTNPVDSNKVKKSYETFGLYAPIGISFNKGSKSGWGLSLTAQLLDLGALVNFYLTEGDQTALPSDFTIRLSNIFAPGVQLGINIPKTPLTLTGGFQYVPALYETSQITSSSEIIASNAVRWNVGLVVDIPMYNIKVWDFNK